MPQGAPEQPEAQFRGLGWTAYQRRRSRFYAALMGATFVLTMAVQLTRFFGKKTVGNSLWVAVGIVGLLFTVFCFVAVHSAVQKRAARRAFVKSRGRTCTSCLYDLNGMGETGTCPECGHAFDVVADAKAWRLDGIAWPGDEGKESRGVSAETRGE